MKSTIQPAINASISLIKHNKFNLILPVFFSKDIHSQLYSYKETKANTLVGKKLQSDYSIKNSQRPFCSLPNIRNQNRPLLNRNATMILDWVYLGDYDDASNKAELKAMKIGYILNCAIECDNKYPSDFYYKHLQMEDEESFNITKYFPLAFDFIEKAKASNNKILIHCQMGISRSATILIAYLMKYHNFSLKSGFVYVKSRRKQVFPNFGFMEQLVKYEASLKRKLI